MRTSQQRTQAAVRIEMVIAYLGDDKVRAHLQLNVSRSDEWNTLRNEVEAIVHVPTVWSGPEAMDVSAVVKCNGNYSNCCHSKGKYDKCRRQGQG